MSFLGLSLGGMELKGGGQKGVGKRVWCLFGFWVVSFTLSSSFSLSILALFF